MKDYPQMLLLDSGEPPPRLRCWEVRWLVSKRQSRDIFGVKMALACKRSLAYAPEPKRDV
jgi:hypothetical protein